MRWFANSRAATALGVVTALLFVGCAGLSQFPKKVKEPSAELKKLDPEFLAAQKAIFDAGTDSGAQMLARNFAMEARIRAIDLRFNEFVQSLAKQSVGADFGVSVVNLAVAGTGAVVSGGMSQIMSAANAGLAGMKASYDKEAFFDQAMPAMLAQMIASRDELRVILLAGMKQPLTVYPLILAETHMDAYVLAGSLPGAVLATAGDARDKAEKAAVELKSSFVKDESGNLIRAFWKPDGTTVNAANKKRIEKFFEENNIVKGESIRFFINADLYTKMRKKLVTELKLK